jgi:hypothetical protein
MQDRRRPGCLDVANPVGPGAVVEDNDDLVVADERHDGGSVVVARLAAMVLDDGHVRQMWGP